MPLDDHSVDINEELSLIVTTSQTMSQAMIRHGWQRIVLTPYTNRRSFGPRMCIVGVLSTRNSHRLKTVNIKMSVPDCLDPLVTWRVPFSLCRFTLQLQVYFSFSSCKTCSCESIRYLVCRVTMLTFIRRAINVLILASFRTVKTLV